MTSGKNHAFRATIALVLCLSITGCFGNPLLPRDVSNTAPLSPIACAQFSIQVCNSSLTKGCCDVISGRCTRSGTVCHESDIPIFRMYASGPPKGSYISATGGGLIPEGQPFPFKPTAAPEDIKEPTKEDILAEEVISKDPPVIDKGEEVLEEPVREPKPKPPPEDAPKHDKKGSRKLLRQQKPSQHNHGRGGCQINIGEECIANKCCKWSKKAKKCTPVADGTACIDGRACAMNTTCLSGYCTSTLTFDSFGDQLGFVADQFGCLDWFNFGHVDPSIEPDLSDSGYIHNMHSLHQVAFNSIGDPVGFASSTESTGFIRGFHFYDAFLGAGFTDGMQVALLPAVGSVPLNPIIMTVNAAAPTHISPALQDITSISISTASPGSPGSYVVDDFMTVLDDLKVFVHPDNLYLSAIPTGCATLAGCEAVVCTISDKSYCAKCAPGHAWNGNKCVPSTCKYIISLISYDNLSPGGEFYDGWNGVMVELQQAGTSIARLGGDFTTGNQFDVELTLEAGQPMAIQLVSRGNYNLYFASLWFDSVEVYTEAGTLIQALLPVNFTYADLGANLLTWTTCITCEDANCLHCDVSSACQLCAEDYALVDGACVESCGTYKFHMIDRYGYGWLAGTVVISYGTTSLTLGGTGPYAFPNGFEKDIFLALPADTVVTVSKGVDGFYPFVVGLEIYAPDGTKLYSLAPGDFSGIGGTGHVMLSLIPCLECNSQAGELCAHCLNSASSCDICEEGYLAIEGLCVPACDYTLTLIDFYRDGWNGATIVLTYGSTTITLGAEFTDYYYLTTNGHTIDVSLQLPQGVEVSIKKGMNGTYCEEVGFELKDSQGSLLYQAVPFCESSAGDTLFSFTACLECDTSVPEQCVSCFTSPSTCDVCGAGYIAVRGSCVAGCDYTFKLLDSAGNGWRGSTILVDIEIAAGSTLTRTLGPMFTSGSEEDIIVTLPPELPVVVKKGATGYDSSEVGLQIISSGLTEIYNVPFGGIRSLPVYSTMVSFTGCIECDAAVEEDCSVCLTSPSTCTICNTDHELVDGQCVDASYCTYNLNMTDSFGDGWNGATILVEFASRAIRMGPEFITGRTKDVSLQLPQGFEVAIKKGVNGPYCEEVGFELKDSQGSLMYEVVPSTTQATSEFCSTQTGAAFLTFTACVECDDTECAFCLNSPSTCDACNEGYYLSASLDCVSCTNINSLCTACSLQGGTPTCDTCSSGSPPSCQELD